MSHTTSLERRLRRRDPDPGTDNQIAIRNLLRARIVVQGDRSGDTPTARRPAANKLHAGCSQRQASAAYLTASEIFLMEIRALAIAFFFAIGTAAGGISGPLVFGNLIETARAADVFLGYLIGAALMTAAGLVEALIGVDAEGRSLEDIARPLTAAEGGIH